VVSGQINGLQSVAGKVSQLAQFETFTGNPNKIADLVKMYSSLTKEQVMAAYKKYIRTAHPVIVSVLTKTSPDGTIAAADNYKIDSSNYKAPDYGYTGLKYVKPKDFDRSKAPKAGPSPVVKVPKFWRKDMPNGVKMIGTENTEIPTVTLTVTVPGGHLMQANDLSKAGLASMFASMMNEDTKNYTAEKLTLELQKLGSSVTVSSSTDGINFNVQTLKKNLDATLKLLEERMLNPNFTEAAFSRIKKQSLESFKIAKSQPAFVADQVFAKMNYGPNHILGISESGTEETVKNITLDDVKAYFNNNMTSQGAKVVIVGDVKETEVLPKLTFLNKLPNKKVVVPSVSAPATNVDKTKVYLVDVPKSAQSEFRVGYSTGLKYDATGEYYKAMLTNYALGGDFNSRLNLNLREDKGWTYGARSGFSGDEYSGDFEFSSGIRADATDSALVEVMKELKNYATNGITEEELSFMKNSLGQRDARAYETGFQKAGFIRRILDYNLPANYVDQQNKILAKITKAEIDAVAKKRLHPDNINILLVGDKAKILDGVKKLGYEVIELDADGNKVEKKAF
ncbi:MAG TPA: pitrilysin family protein, partial [Chitinophagaceae bacterium]|nr:pitrilysin family protein [Chitinophagaceae bacterium]